MPRRHAITTFIAALGLVLASLLGAPTTAAAPAESGRIPAVYDKLGFPRPPATYAGDVIGFDGTPGVHRIHVWSSAMSRYIPMVLQAPESAKASPAALMLLLNGSDGGDQGYSWHGKSDIFPALAGRNVYLLNVLDGAATYYTNWKTADPVVGRPQWETFLNHELVDAVGPVFARTTGALSGKRSVVGVSMAATSALNLVTARPGYWTSAASISGCQEVSTEEGYASVQVVTGREGADADNMWGPRGDPGWAEHDAYLNAEKLRGTHLHLFSGHGRSGGAHDTPADPYLRGYEYPAPVIYANQMTTGVLLESLAGRCTEKMARRLEDLGIPATVVIEPTAKHAWGYFRDGLHAGLPGILAAIGA